jgi:DUF4097 and DUF4098 domain-containing protein YvlB
MMRANLYSFVAASVFAALATSVTVGQDFNRSYRVAAGGTVSVRNVSGDVEVVGHDGDQIVVNGYKEGRDRDQVEVEDLSGANGVDIRVKYPRNCNCDASIRFVVQVPRSTRYAFNSISSASGNIKVTNVSGDIKVNTASGDVLVSNVAGEVNANTASGEMRVREVAGTVSANSASGNVEVEIARLEGAESMKFSSASGDVNVRVPSGLDADVSMSTASGQIRTNLPIEVRESKYGAGSKAQGRVGSGSRILRLSTASGNVSLMSN